MIKINIGKKELETFFDKFWNKEKDWYLGEFKINLLNFKDFKKLFCNTEFDFSEDEKNIKTYKKIYDNISSKWTAKIYVEIRKFIIKKFTEKIKFCPYCWKNRHNSKKWVAKIRSIWYNKAKYSFNFNYVK